jgi:hypothetical protein
MTEKKKPEIVFAPGCFDNFDGTQEELDELVAEINRLVDSGDIFKKSKPLDPDTLDDEELEMLSDILNSLEDGEDQPPGRLLN